MRVTRIETTPTSLLSSISLITAWESVGRWPPGPSSPLLTANWRAKSNRWLVPVGGGVNKMFPGKMPVQIKMHAYWHAARPDTASNWQIMISVQPVILLK